MEERLRDRLAHPVSSHRIDPRPDLAILPLYFAQERLWFLEQLHPGLTAFNRPWALRLRGKLDVGALGASLTEIVKRHEVLRSSYAAKDGRPIQHIHSPDRVEMPVINLQHLHGSLKDSHAANLAVESVRTPFKLDSGLLIRPELLVLNSTDHILALTTHHIAFDGWSENVFLSELVRIYEAITANETPSLPRLRIQYSDFAYWQRQRLRADLLARLLSFWRATLEDLPARLDLPTDRHRPSVRTYNGAVLNFRLSPDLSNNIRRLTQKYDLTLFMTLLAAFNMVLFLTSGQRDIAIATLSAGRNNRRMEPLIGFFVNSLVLRTDLSGNPTFHELLQRVRRAALAAYVHQELPFSRLVQELGPKRDAAYAPLVQHAFQLRNMPSSDAAFSPLQVERFTSDAGISIYDLSLSVADEEAGLTCEFVYNSDLFDAATIDQLAERFQAVLESTGSDPGRRLMQLQSLVPQRAAAAMPAEENQAAAPGYLRRSNLTENQVLIWAGEHLRPRVPLYSVPYAFSIDSEIDVLRFREAFQILLNQSDALRTVFRQVAGVPMREVLDSMPYQLETIDFSQQAEPESALDKWLKDRSRGIFDLSRQAFDCALLKVSERRWVWFLSLHHIVGDAWAISVIFRHLQTLYASLEEAKGPLIHEVPAFERYIDREREFRASAEYRATQTYWNSKLEREREALTLYGRHAVGDSTEVDRRIVDLGRQRTNRLTSTAAQIVSIGKSGHSSVLNSMAALLYAYLYRVSGNRGLLLAVPFHNRRTPDERETIGLLMGVLVLKVRIDEGETFRTLIAKVSEEAEEALRHRRYPVANPVNRRVYEVTLNYQTVSFQDFLGAPVETTWLHTGHDEDTLTLRLHDYGDTGSLKAEFEFNTRVFSAAQQERAVQHFIRMLDEFLRDPDQAIDHVQMLPPDERNCLLVQVNRSDTSLSDCKTVVEEFEYRVNLNPHEVAVQDGTETISYAELNARSNRLANFLQSTGVGPEKLVGLCIERSIEMIVGMLAILKSGGPISL